MAPKLQPIVCEPYVALAVKSFICDTDVIVPVEESEDRKWITVRASDDWVRKVMTGVKAYSPELTVAVYNVHRELSAAKDVKLM